MAHSSQSRPEKKHLLKPNNKNKAKRSSLKTKEVILDKVADAYQAASDRVWDLK